VTGWFRRNQRAVGIGVTVSALALLGIAVVLGWAMFTRMPPSSAGPGSSSEPSASALPSPSAEVTPTPEPTATAEPTPGFEAPAGILPPNSLAVVVVDALHVRSEPRLDADVLATLPADTVVELSLGWIGPTAVDGIDWYAVVYYGDFGGYVAAGADGDRYLELAPPRCEEGEPDLAAVVLITEWERLACFGDRSLTVTGTYGCVPCGIAYPRGGYEPHWLASPDNLNYLGSGRVFDLGPAELILHFSPESGLDVPPNASILRVTGHFNDPASSTCVIRPTMDDVEIGAEVDPAIAELYCREQFVVDAYEIIGSDPDFTYPTDPQASVE
jgi:hypothetical protein